MHHSCVFICKRALGNLFGFVGNGGEVSDQAVVSPGSLHRLSARVSQKKGDSLDAGGVSVRVCKSCQMDESEMEGEKPSGSGTRGFPFSQTFELQPL